MTEGGVPQTGKVTLGGESARIRCRWAVTFGNAPTTQKLQLKPEHLSKAFRERLDPVLVEPIPDEWLEPLVRELYGEPDQEQ